MYNKENREALRFNSLKLMGEEPDQEFEIDKQDLEILKDPTKYISFLIQITGMLIFSVLRISLILDSSTLPFLASKGMGGSLKISSHYCSNSASVS